MSLGEGIVSLEVIRYGPNDLKACLISQTDGILRLWKLTSCCETFGTSTSDVNDLTLVQDSVSSSYLISRGSHDLRGFESSTGEVNFIFDSSTVVEGVISYSISVIQKKIYCLMESEIVKVFEIRLDREKAETRSQRVSHADIEGDEETFLTRLKKEGSVQEETESTAIDIAQRLDTDCLFVEEFNIHDIVVELGRVTCMTIVNPLQPEVDTQETHSKEMILFGSSSGTAVMVDIRPPHDLILVENINNNAPIFNMQYRKYRKEVICLGQDNMTTSSQVHNIRVMSLQVQADNIGHEAWKLIATPYMISGILNFSVLEVSAETSIFCYGLINGTSRLMRLLTSGRVVEVLPADVNVFHEDRILSISFCDPIKVSQYPSIESLIHFIL